MSRPADTWVLVADEGVARVLSLPGRGMTLQPVHTMTDAGAHASEAALRRDAHGRRGGTEHPSNATTSAGEDKLHQEARGFAGRVAQWLSEAERHGRFGVLHVAAAPRFLGLLRQALPPAVATRVADERDLDLTGLDERALTERFFGDTGETGRPSGAAPR